MAFLKLDKKVKESITPASREFKSVSHTCYFVYSFFYLALFYPHVLVLLHSVFFSDVYYFIKNMYSNLLKYFCTDGYLVIIFSLLLL